MLQFSFHETANLDEKTLNNFIKEIKLNSTNISEDSFFKNIAEAITKESQFKEDMILHEDKERPLPVLYTGKFGGCERINTQVINNQTSPFVDLCSSEKDSESSRNNSSNMTFENFYMNNMNNPNPVEKNKSNININQVKSLRIMKNNIVKKEYSSGQNKTKKKIMNSEELTLEKIRIEKEKINELKAKNEKFLSKIKSHNNEVAYNVNIKLLNNKRADNNSHIEKKPEGKFNAIKLKHRERSKSPSNIDDELREISQNFKKLNLSKSKERLKTPERSPIRLKKDVFYKIPSPIRFNVPTPRMKNHFEMKKSSDDKIFDQMKKQLFKSKSFEVSKGNQENRKLNIKDLSTLGVRSVLKERKFK